MENCLGNMRGWSRAPEYVHIILGCVEIMKNMCSEYVGIRADDARNIWISELGCILWSKNPIVLENRPQHSENLSQRKYAKP